MLTYRTPGVYKEEKFLEPAAELRTGVPALLGYTKRVPRDDEGNKKFYVPHALSLWPQFEETFGPPLFGGYLAHAVRGFFENRGSLCHVVPLDDALSPEDALARGLEALASWDTIDLVCAPDIIRPRQPEELPPLDTFDPIWREYISHLLEQWGRSPNPEEVLIMQNAVLSHCDASDDRFAILDCLPGAGVSQVLGQRQRLSGTKGALYYPWVRVQGNGLVPPCGHVAGVYARTDEQRGVHKAPANEVLEGVLDLEASVTNAEQDLLNPVGVNCLRAFPGRGIRVWGARTLSRDENWTYVSVCRLFLSVARWVERTMSSAVFEPNNASLWARINRELTAYFSDLFRQGALKGRTAEEAFSVKCDAETNPPEVRDAGRLVTEIRLAPTRPNEFVVVRIIHDSSGVTITLTPPKPSTPQRVPPLPAGRPRADVTITHIEYNPSGLDVAGEYVVVQNQAERAVDLTDWTLSDLANHTFVFPPLTLKPDLSVRVWTKGGTNTATDLYWGRGAAIWNNIGDRAFLRDREGNLVHIYTYSPLDQLSG